MEKMIRVARFMFVDRMSGPRFDSALDHIYAQIRLIARAAMSVYFASICSRIRASCFLNSGVNSAPKSSASNTWRISTSVSSKGARLSHWVASSRELHFHSQKPATSSFVSANGPSITDFCPFENLTRAPFELGCKPSPANITPAFANSSLNFPMSVSNCLLGMTPASELLSAFTITMNRIEFSPFSRFLPSPFGRRVRDEARSLLRPKTLTLTLSQRERESKYEWLKL